jgi:outer membrane protein OmpA-like peptidoglycan-associated protein
MSLFGQTQEIKWQQVYLDSSKSNNLLINDFQINKKGNIFIGTDTGLQIVDSSGVQILSKKNNTLPFNEINKLFIDDKSNSLFIGSYVGNVAELFIEKKNNNFKSYHIKPENTSNGLIKSIHSINDSIYIFTKKGKLYNLYSSKSCYDVEEEINEISIVNNNRWIRTNRNLIKNKDTMLSIPVKMDKFLMTKIINDSVAYNLVKKGNKIFYSKGLEQKYKKIKNWKVEKDINIIFSTDLNEQFTTYIFNENGSIYLLDLLKMKIEYIYTHEKKIFVSKVDVIGNKCIVSTEGSGLFIVKNLKLEANIKNEIRDSLAMRNIEKLLFFSFEKDTTNKVKFVFQGEEISEGDTIPLKDINFDYLSWQIKDTKIVDSLHQFLVENPKVNVELHGHTGVNSTRTKDIETNYTLSIKRVQSIKNYLIEKGISTKRIQVIGFGGTQPKYGRRDKRNRRVEILVLYNNSQ